MITTWQYATNPLKGNDIMKDLILMLELSNYVVDGYTDNTIFIALNNKVYGVPATEEDVLYFMLRSAS